jgi:hypothetical protein
MRNLSGRIPMMGLALVAVLVLGAIAASSASAEPEFGKCVAAPGTGNYTESNCVKKAKTLTSEKQFERTNAKEITNTNFTISGGTAFLEGESGVKYICSGRNGTGKLDEDGSTLAAKAVENVVLRYTGCGIPAFGLQCKSGTVPEEIVSNTLEGNLVYASKAKKEVLQELHPQVKGGAFEAFECGGGEITYVIKEKPVSEGGKEGHNCIFGVIPTSQVDVMSSTGQLSYRGSETEAGRQVPQTDEKLKPAKCNEEAEASGGPPELWAINQEETLTYEEVIELFA